MLPVGLIYCPIILSFYSFNGLAVWGWGFGLIECSHPLPTLHCWLYFNINNINNNNNKINLISNWKPPFGYCKQFDSESWWNPCFKYIYTTNSSCNSRVFSSPLSSITSSHIPPTILTAFPRGYGTNIHMVAFASSVYNMSGYLFYPHCGICQFTSIRPYLVTLHCCIP